MGLPHGIVSTAIRRNGRTAHHAVPPSPDPSRWSATLPVKKTVAAALADALLACPPDLPVLLQRCAEVIGSRPAWLAMLLRSLLRNHGGHWNERSREALVLSILHSPLFKHAWSGGQGLQVLSYPLTPPRMAPAPPFLNACLPVLPTQADLAHWLGTDGTTLDAVIRSLQYRDGEASARLWHYRYRWLDKRSGGRRLLESPKPRLRDWQRRILTGLLEYLPPHEAAHGFRRGHSCLTHASLHVKRAVVVRMDLEDFFLTVGAGRVEALFRSLGYPAGTAACLTVLCTHRVPPRIAHAPSLAGHHPELAPWQWQAARRLRSPHLPQGAPTSPALANLCAFNLDLRLQAAAEECGAVYSRYADDLTFSGGEVFRRGVPRFLPLVAAIAAAEGFAVNFRKTRVMGRAARQRVTGVVVNDKLNVERRHYDRIKAILHNCRRHGPESQSELPPRQFRRRLAGHVAHIAALNPRRGERLKEMLESVVWAGGGEED